MKPEDTVHRIGQYAVVLVAAACNITLAGFRDRFKIHQLNTSPQRIGEACGRGHEPRNKPPSTGGYGGGFGGGRRWLGGRGGDRSFEVALAAVKVRAVVRRDALSGCGQLSRP